MNEGVEKLNLMQKNWFNLTRSISHMVYPDVCLICTDELTLKEASICSFCKEEMEFTFFETYLEPTSLDKVFWGRVSIASTYALLYFEKGKSTQQILHALKYKSTPQVGEEFGKIIGRRIKQLEGFKDLDVLIPVPIHPKKEFVRGYNQSEQIAKGIAEILSIPMDSHFLKKQHHTESQTKRGRFARWDNVVNNFTLRKRELIPNHIAIVDDVITTGATIEALVRSIHKNYPDIRISIISLALTK
jgi:ComF family protein